MKRITRSLFYWLWPNLENKRFLRRHAPVEGEIVLLPALVSPDKVALDIGANRGLYIYYLRKITAKVIAFEPLAPMQQWLARFYPELDVRAVALSDNNGNSVIRYPRGNFSWATLAESNELNFAGAEVVEIDVPLRTLDSYDFEDVGFIKIDVEGHEEAVLRGAARTLESLPNLLIEVEDRHNPGAPDRVRSILSRLDYSGFYLSDGVLTPAEHFDPTLDAPIENVGRAGKQGRYINNFIFVPNCRRDMFCEHANRILGPAKTMTRN